jgi:hypothetical protein
MVHLPGGVACQAFLSHHRTPLAMP